MTMLTQIQVVINTDEQTATEPHTGKVYSIAGIHIAKPKEQGDKFYPITSRFCKTIIYKGLREWAVISGEREITLL